jgi:hypothetical protein
MMIEIEATAVFDRPTRAAARGTKRTGGKRAVGGQRARH